MNPDETYAKVKAADGNIYYMAKALLDTVFAPAAPAEDKAEGKKGKKKKNKKQDAEAEAAAAAEAAKAEEAKNVPPYEILEEMTGKDLEYREYEPLYQCAADSVKKQHKKAFFVYCDDYVTMTDGTGIVHIAPAFGEDDARIGRKYDAPFVQMVDDKGVMKPETPFAGMRCKPTQAEMDEGAVSADPEVLKELEARGMLFAAPKFEHDYPHCWRCNTPLLYYARESWFIEMTKVRDDLVRNNKEINWIPANIGEGRFGNWLENIQDWGISRNRYWGTPLNIWECPDCGKQISVGSRKELAELTGDPSAEQTELHRPYVDNYFIKCAECGGQMKRVPEVIDCWFDSGAMPFAQYHYPFENKELFEKNFPASFISEAVDQTRGWFYSLHAISTLLFNKPAYKNVVVLGLVLDKDGEKMSKSKGNAVDPFDALQKHGADAIRWYFYSNSAPWLPNKFHDKAVQEGQRKFLGTLWNTYAFYTLYAEIDQFDPTKYTLDYANLPVMDKWLLSRMNTMIKKTDDNLDRYRIPEAATALSDFVDEMSNWYVRRCRDRFWAKGMEQDKINAYMTLYTALVGVCKAAAPMIPFMTEEIYQNIVRSVDKTAPESIHLCDFPAVDESMIDADLEKSMAEVLKVVVMGRACRNLSGIKNRQPIARMFVKAPEAVDGYFVEIIENELNVKAVDFTDDVREFTSYTFKPQLRTVGPKYGKQLGGIRKYLAELDGNAAMDELNEKGSISFDVNGTTVELTREDLLIEMTQKEGYISQEDGGYTVVLDTNLTPELIEEGFVYELISKIQTMRKDSGFEVTDRIRVAISDNEKLTQILRSNEKAIADKVLAVEVLDNQTLANAKEWDINGEKAVISVEKV